MNFKPEIVKNDVLISGVVVIVIFLFLWFRKLNHGIWEVMKFESGVSKHQISVLYTRHSSFRLLMFPDFMWRYYMWEMEWNFTLDFKLAVFLLLITCKPTLVEVSLTPLTLCHPGGSWIRIWIPNSDISFLSLVANEGL